MDDLELLLHNDHELLGSQVVHVVVLIKTLEQNTGPTVPLFAEFTRQTDLLQQQLREHFAFEEAQVFPKLGDALPHVSPRLDRLRQQHEKISEAFSALVASLQAGSEPDWSAAVARSEHFQALFSEHANSEAEILRELSKSYG